VPAREKKDDFTGTARFAVARRLGHGGAGIVYEAHDRELGVRVALKRLRRLSPDAILRFKSEFRSVEDVEHPNLVALGELFEEAGQWFFTMEYVEGTDLLAWVTRPVRERSRPAATELDHTMQDGTSDVPAGAPVSVAKPMAHTLPGFDEARLRSGMVQLLRALEALHAAGKVHRDVKPSNALATPEGRVVLLDFGLATDVVREDRDVRAEGIVGTVSYMAPEQALGLAVDARADMYSVGVVLYRALTGRLPFDRLPQPGDAQVPALPSRIAPGVPEDLDALCMNLLRRSPELRPTARGALHQLGRGTDDSSAGGGSLASIAPPAPKRFVGRTPELAMLREAFDETLRGDCVVVAVTGESGLGKSTLVRHFGEIAVAEYGAVVLSGRCWERESVPFKAMDGIVDALARWLARAPRADVEAILPPNAALLAQVFPSLRPIIATASDGAPQSTTAPASARGITASRGPPSATLHDPASARSPTSRGPIAVREQRAQLFAAVRALFAGLAQRRPVVLVVDDLQWTDADGLALLREIVRLPDAPSVLLVATVRATAAAGETELVERIREDARALAVEPLEPDDARALALEVLTPSRRDGGAEGDDASDDDRIAALADAIALESHGHPLFVDALARSALASAQAPECSPAEVGNAAPALRLQEVLIRRVARLDRAARRVVEIASVAGSPLRLEVLSRAAGAAPETLPRTVRALQIARLVRTRGEGRTRTVEPYHDRVRAAVVAPLDDAERRSAHLAIADAMEALGEDEADAIVAHFAAAGEGARAAGWIERAASNAMRALAFDRAAALLQSLLASGTLDLRATRAAQARLGEALVGAGRGLEAADALLAAARGASPSVAFELQRRAAEQLLTSGHLERGLETLRPVLESVGIAPPATRLGAAASLAWGRARLAARGLQFRERQEHDVPMEQLQRVDAIGAAAAALGMVDTIRGADLQTRHLLAALDAGEPLRLARAIALEAAFSATGGTSRRDRTQAALALSGRLAVDRGDPLASAQVVVCSGVAAFLEGRWIAARDLLIRADGILREECSGAGVAFQIVSVNLYLLGALLHTGDIGELGRRLPPLLEDARSRGDRYALTHLRSSIAAFIELLRDDPSKARHEARSAIEAWTPAGTHMPHFFDVLAQAQIDLYEGSSALAAARTERAFSALRRALLLRVQFVRVKTIELRGRTALAVAVRSPRPPARALQGVEREIRALRGEHAGWADALADLLHGGALAAREDPRAPAAFALAARAFDGVGMALHAAVARARADGSAEKEGHLWLRTQGVARPERLVAMLSPGAK
jgi:eukaryotic-like serine/threonine-protein kinase